MDNLRNVKFSDINLSDTFFNSLKDSYIGFEDWFRKKASEGKEAFVYMENGRILDFLYLKDENEGLLHTGIIEMPKVYIMSNIDLRMGERANPTVGTFRVVAMPENVDDYERLVYRITYLDEDIYGV